MVFLPTSKKLTVTQTSKKQTVNMAHNLAGSQYSQIVSLCKSGNEQLALIKQEITLLVKHK